MFVKFEDRSLNNVLGGCAKMVQKLCRAIH